MDGWTLISRIKFMGGGEEIFTVDLKILGIPEQE